MVSERRDEFDYGRQTGTQGRERKTYPSLPVLLTSRIGRKLGAAEAVLDCSDHDRRCRRRMPSTKDHRLCHNLKADSPHRIHVLSTMFRLLKEALAAPTPPQPSQARRTSATTATPDPPGKRVSVSEPSETTATEDESMREVKRDGKEEDWEVKRTIGSIREWTERQRPNLVLDLAQIETVITLFFVDDTPSLTSFPGSSSLSSSPWYPFRHPKATSRHRFQPLHLVFGSDKPSFERRRDSKRHSMSSNYLPEYIHHRYTRANRRRASESRIL